MSTADYRKRLKATIDEARRQGWTVRQTGGKHVQLIPPDPDKPIVVAASTVSDYRGIRNLEALMRKSGLNTPE